MTTKKEFLRSDIAMLRHQLIERYQRLLAVIASENGLEWEQLTDRLAILHNPQQRDGWSKMGYIGFTTKHDAEKCAQVLRTKGLLRGMEIREAKRLKACRWEIKAMDIAPEVMRCLSCSELKSQVRPWSGISREEKSAMGSKKDSQPENYKAPEWQHKDTEDLWFCMKGSDESGGRHGDSGGGFPLW